jgi:hypothetical protein
MLLLRWHVRDEMFAVNRQEYFRGLRPLRMYNCESDPIRVVVLSAADDSSYGSGLSASLSCHVVPDTPSRLRSSSVRTRNTTSDRCANAVFSDVSAIRPIRPIRLHSSLVPGARSGLSERRR